MHAAFACLQAPASSHRLRASQADKDIADFYNKLDASTREYSHEEHQKREVMTVDSGWCSGGRRR